MNLTETYNMTMNEVIAKCNIVDQKVHTDNEGNIQAIEVKYVPKEVSEGTDYTPRVHSPFYTK